MTGVLSAQRLLLAPAVSPQAHAFPAPGICPGNLGQGAAELTPGHLKPEDSAMTPGALPRLGLLALAWTPGCLKDRRFSASA